MTNSGLIVERRDAPLIVSIPHTGTDLAGLDDRLVSPWLARKDSDWRIDGLYDFVRDLGATIVRTTISRTVIDVNRDPSGVSLYPGRTTTELCPTTTFDGEKLYRDGKAPDADEIADRTTRWFQPYHVALAAEIARLRAKHDKVILYDCHSIRSVIPRLFEGTLPGFNLGVNFGRAADPRVIATVATILAGSGETFVVDGRFKGGWITRSYGEPSRGVHALQMEVACRLYLGERPGPVEVVDWPAPMDPLRAALTRKTLRAVLEAALQFAGRKNAWPIIGASTIVKTQR